MKKLTTVSKLITIMKDEIDRFEVEMQISFPDYFKEFLLQYNGVDTKEVLFGDRYWVQNFLPLKSELNASIEKVLEGMEVNYNRREWIPFAIDPGGWVYSISLNNDTKGQVWLDRFDSGEEFPFEYVALSFEDFINGLQAVA